MSGHGLRIDELAVMHRELGRGARRDCPKRNRSVPTAAPEEDDKSAVNAQRGNFIENQSNE